MRTLACVPFAVTASASLLAAAVDPARWPLVPAVLVAVVLVAGLTVVQVRANRSARRRSPRHRRVEGQVSEDRGRPVWHGFVGETVTTGEIEVHAAADTRTNDVRVPAAVPAALPVRRAIRAVNADPFVELVPTRAREELRPPWQYWTPALDRRLLRLFDECRSTSEIAIRMRRDRDTIDLRLIQLLVDAAADFGDEPAAPRRYERISDAEAAYLRGAVERAEALDRMARSVGRTPREVGRFLVDLQRLTVR